MITQGRYDEGIVYLQRTLDSLTRRRQPLRSRNAVAARPRARGEAGRNEQGLALLTRAPEIIRGVGDRDDEFRVLTDLARVHLQLGAGQS
jgi:hypothetical protein